MNVLEMTEQERKQLFDSLQDRAQQAYDLYVELVALMQEACDHKFVKWHDSTKCGRCDRICHHERAFTLERACADCGDTSTMTVRLEK